MLLTAETSVAMSETDSCSRLKPYQEKLTAANTIKTRKKKERRRIFFRIATARAQLIGVCCSNFPEGRVVKRPLCCADQRLLTDEKRMIPTNRNITLCFRPGLSNWKLSNYYLFSIQMFIFTLIRSLSNHSDMKSLRWNLQYCYFLLIRAAPSLTTATIHHGW